MSDSDKSAEATAALKPVSDALKRAAAYADDESIAIALRELSTLSIKHPFESMQFYYRAARESLQAARTYRSHESKAKNAREAYDYFPHRAWITLKECLEK